MNSKTAENTTAFTKLFIHLQFIENDKHSWLFDLTTLRMADQRTHYLGLDWSLSIGVNLRSCNGKWQKSPLLPQIDGAKQSRKPWSGIEVHWRALENPGHRLVSPINSSGRKGVCRRPFMVACFWSSWRPIHSCVCGAHRLVFAPGNWRQESWVPDTGR